MTPEASASKKYTLLVPLNAPMQSYGDERSKFQNRGTRDMPTKSAVFGMILSAFGIGREDKEALTAFRKVLRFGVRRENDSKHFSDYHTVHAKLNKSGSKSKTIITNRYYLAGAAFVVALESENRELLERISQALTHPAHCLYLGRKCCVIANPILPVIIERKLSDALQECPWSASEKYKKRWAWKHKDEAAPELLIECEPESVAFVTDWRQDNPLYFGSEYRQYGRRAVISEFATPPELKDTHDPMSELFPA